MNITLLMKELSSYREFGGEDLEKIARLWKPQIVKKNEIVFKTGDIVR